MANSPSPEKLEKRARNVLLFQLSKSMKTKHQLAEILVKREIPDEIALPLLDRFEEVQLIDDTAFAASYVRSRLERGKSSRLIARELAQKGVSKDIAEQALSVISQDDEQAMVLELAKVRWERLGNVDRETRYRRVSGFLLRRGFAPGLVSSALREVGASD